jgi:hypothetical protein
VRRFLSLGSTLACVAALLLFAAAPVTAKTAAKRGVQQAKGGKILQQDRLQLSHMAARH